MSSSNVYSHFAWTEEAHPVGSEQFVDQYLRQREKDSPEWQQLQQLEQQHQAEVQQALQNGYAQGEAVGLQRGLDETRRVEAQLAATINALLSFRQTVFEQAKVQLVELAFAIADKITAARAVAERDTVIETIHRCIGEILDKTRMKIRVNPAELDFVRQRFDELVKSNEAAAAAVVESDNRVSAGGCIIETDSGSADARIESQLRMLREKLITLE
ncbi:MAG: FliH/SctL family protein [candidate division Zixibacteria bacterium]|jgi:flagellar assembly protein FliH|nr:FliH/SctL family protein [candidate division Zixibacteria bacterium]